MAKGYITLDMLYVSTVSATGIHILALYSFGTQNNSTKSKQQWCITAERTYTWELIKGVNIKIRRDDPFQYVLNHFNWQLSNVHCLQWSVTHISHPTFLSFQQQKIETTIQRDLLFLTDDYMDPDWLSKQTSQEVTTSSSSSRVAVLMFSCHCTDYYYYYYYYYYSVNVINCATFSCIRQERLLLEITKTAV